MFRRSSGLSAGKYPVPNLDLNYAATRALSGIETFTRASTAWGFNSVGTLTQYAANAPRFDHDPAALTPRGLLVEEQRTNLLLNSNTFSAWSNSSLSVTGSSGSAPTGATEAWLLNATGTEGRGALNIAIPADTSVYAYSIHLRAGSSAVTDIRLSFVGGSEFDARITWATASIAVKKGTHAFTPTLQSIGSGWYRAVMGAANTSRTQVLPYIFPAGQGTSATGTVLAFGGQLEAGSFATSYIPTTSASVTRAADVCGIATSGISGFSASEGTLFIEWSAFGYGSGSTMASLEGSGGSGSDSIVLFATGSNFRARVRAPGSTTAAQIDIASLTAGTAYKAASAWRTDGFQAQLGSTAGTPDTSGAVPVGLTTLRIGGNGAGAGSYLNGNIRRVAYYPRALDNPTLGRITS